jgi:SAM-dependent methyltransferase
MTANMRLLEDPRVYRLWQMPFATAKFAPVERHGAPSAARRVLDVGCGPGTNARFFSKSDYLGLDINPRYIEQAKRRFGDRFVVADVTRDELPEQKPFDFVLINSLLHHLDTHDVRQLLAAVARHLDVDGHVHILDLVQPKRPGAARLLARLDRGDFPRPLVDWETLFSEAFEPVVLEPYSLPHRPVLWNMVYFKGRARR